MGPGQGHTMTMSGQGLLLLAVNWAFRPKPAGGMSKFTA